MKSSLLSVCFQIILPYTWVKYARCSMTVILQFQCLQFAELHTGMDLQENSANSLSKEMSIPRQIYVGSSVECTSNFYGLMNQDVIKKTISRSLGTP